MCKTQAVNFCFVCDMAWTTIMLIGDEPLQAAQPVEFVGPNAHGSGNVLQFFTAGGNISTWRAAEAVLGARYTDRAMFILDTGKDGEGVYVRLWEVGAAAEMHGNIYWLGDTLISCIQVNPLLLWNSTIPLVFPIVRVIGVGN